MTSFSDLIKAQAARAALKAGAKVPAPDPLSDDLEKALAEDRADAARLLKQMGVEVPK